MKSPIKHKTTVDATRRYKINLNQGGRATKVVLHRRYASIDRVHTHEQASCEERTSKVVLHSENIAE